MALSLIYHSLRSDFFLPSPFHNMLDVTLVTRMKMEVFKCLHSTSICILQYRTSISFVLKKIPPNPFISSFSHDIICSSLNSIIDIVICYWLPPLLAPLPLMRHILFKKPSLKSYCKAYILRLKKNMCTCFLKQWSSFFH